MLDYLLLLVLKYNYNGALLMKKGVKITLIVIGSLFAITLIGKAIDPGEQ